jgi:hypothetical protein
MKDAQWGEMLDVLKDIGTHLAKQDRKTQTPPKHYEVCHYCNVPIEEGVIKGGYTYCNTDHAIKNALKNAKGEKK